MRHYKSVLIIIISIFILLICYRLAGILYLEYKSDSFFKNLVDSFNSYDITSFDKVFKDNTKIIFNGKEIKYKNTREIIKNSFDNQKYTIENILTFKDNQSNFNKNLYILNGTIYGLYNSKKITENFKITLKSTAFNITIDTIEIESGDGLLKYIFFGDKS